MTYKKEINEERIKRELEERKKRYAENVKIACGTIVDSLSVPLSPRCQFGIENLIDCLGEGGFFQETRAREGYAVAITYFVAQEMGEDRGLRKLSAILGIHPETAKERLKELKGYLVNQGLEGEKLENVLKKEPEPINDSYLKNT